MSLVDTSIRRPVFAWMLMVGLIAFGWLSFRDMGVSQLPDVDFPVVNISASLEGAAPEVMETDVVDPIEGAVISVEGVKSISSSARAGSANITLEFEIGKNIDVAVQEIQTKLGQAQRQLPDDIDPPIVTKSNPEDQPILWLAVTSEALPPADLMAYVRDVVRDRFTTIPGVSDVFLGGYIDPSLRVWASEPKLAQYQLTVLDVVKAIQSEHNEKPSGRVESGEKELNIRTMGEASSVEEFRKISINTRGGAPVYTPIPLTDVAKVELGLSDIRRKARSSGKPAIGLGIRKQRGVNAVDVAKGVRARMEEVKKTLPEGMTLEVRNDTTRFIEEAVGELNFTLLLSALLTALVCWAFLGSWSATLNVILAIPTSVVGTFIVLKALGFTLNTFTLLGLSLAIGIVVDDAIMVLENIARRREEGKDRLSAAYLGAREVTFAAMAATVAVIAIFLPVAFMTGVIGRYFFQFGVTISVAVALSLLEALTLTPMRCSQFLSIGERKTWFGRSIEGGFKYLAEAYGRVIPGLIRYRWIVIPASIVVFAASLTVSGKLKKEFVPPQDQGTLFIRLKAPDGSTLDYTDAKMIAVEKLITDHPAVDRYFASTGGFGGGDVSSGVIFVTLKDRKLRSMSQQQVGDQLREQMKEVKGVRAFVQDISLSGFGGGRGYPVEFSIQGPELDGLVESYKKMNEELTKSGLVTDIDSNYRANTQEVHIVPDREKARERGVSVADIGATVSAMMGGTVAGRYTRGGKRFDIRVQLADVERSSLQAIDRLKVRNNRGELIPLRQMVKIEQKPGFQQINRDNRRREISIYGNLAKGVSQQAALDRIQEIGKKVLPAGYSLVEGGSAQTFRESFQSLIFALVLGLFVSYMVLASQFNSFIDPITVLVALPFSISGAFVGLWVGGQSINVFSMIGIILLMGIVKKNSILLVDFTNQMRDRGRDLKSALVEACPLRLRPILMTSFATIAGALPPALAIGPGAESRVPMAAAVIGGALFSTVLTLFVVPSVYYVFARKRELPLDLEAIYAEEQRENAAHRHGGVPAG